MVYYVRWNSNNYTTWIVSTDTSLFSCFIQTVKKSRHGISRNAQYREKTDTLDDRDWFI